MPEKSTKTVQAAQASFDIIDAIQRLDGATLAELSETLERSRSSVYAHLNTLQQNGYVTKRGEVYHLDFKFLFLGEYTKRRNDAYKLAESHVKDIASKCDEYVDFCVEQNGRILTVHLAVNGIQSPKFDIAEYYHMNTTAQGKATLASMSRDRVEEIIEQWGLPQRTENTITSKERLFAELETIREQGYAVSNQECIEGLRAIAVPIVGPQNSHFGTFAISGPTYEMTDEVTENELLELLLEARQEFEKQMREEYASLFL